MKLQCGPANVTEGAAVLPPLALAGHPCPQFALCHLIFPCHSKAGTSQRPTGALPINAIAQVLPVVRICVLGQHLDCLTVL